MQKYAPSKEINGVNYIPTVFPESVTLKNNDELLEKSKIDIDVKSFPEDKFDIKKLNPAKTNLFPQLPENLKIAIDIEAMTKWFLEKYPPDREEIAEWMAGIAAMNAMADARCKEYNQNSIVKARAGDGCIPGVSLDGAWFEREWGWAFRRQGTRCHYPGNVIRMMPMQNATLISRDWLGFAATGRPYDWSIQYHAFLGHFFRLASKIGRTFFLFRGWAGNLPVFLAQCPPKNTKVLRIFYRIWCSDDCDLLFTFRSPNNYTRKLDIPGRIRLSSGRNDVYIEIANYQQVPHAVHHLEFSRYPKIAIQRYEVRRVR